MEKKVELNPKKLRTVAGGFATGVTVVCIKTRTGLVKGMTANSFLSVSLDPPLVLFSVQDSGTLLDHCEIGKSVGISILGDHQKIVSDQFAGMTDEDLNVEFTKQGSCNIIANSLAWYETTIHKMITVGDHQLIICEVLDMDRNESMEPLLYFSGYKSIGENI